MKLIPPKAYLPLCSPSSRINNQHSSTAMPSRASTLNLQVLLHPTATDFLNATEHILEKHGLTSNIILPFAIKARKNERLPTSNARGTAYWSAPPAALPSQMPKQFWMTQWTVRGAGSVPTLDFVLAITEGQLGAYPVFFWSPHQSIEMSSAFLFPRIQAIVARLCRTIPAERVFSIFGQEPVVNAFTNVWTQATGKIPEPEAFYAAKFSYCSRKHLQPPPQLPAGHELRLATIADLDQCAQLCKEFADDSVFFPLSLEGGRQEAKSMIDAKHLWVYATPQGIATVVASTRRTPNAVASINKVYTPPDFRGKGCAQRLVAHVTRALLDGTDCATAHEAVVLYVSHGNPAARVYNRVGFQGLDDGLPLPPLVENWLETGFQATHRGHW
ncbi:hypothetical protein BN14_08905 [Rhizoctonia solani AG-1 IB]|uniref:N-acetyltransferase domain-containing protein n=3 Tax=Rhizoctonia solani TaxID=456999 RepID=A0A8H2WGH5_9AGAM|nr:unnamed protein product [Rhizoctonia solani]CCO34797.1 hypothetical protein BN14_08905 [Rhizoctonia solani AG-1 IB]